MAALFLLNPPKRKAAKRKAAKRKAPKRKAAKRTTTRSASTKRTSRSSAKRGRASRTTTRRKPRNSRRGGTMAQKTTRRRGRRKATRRKSSTTKAARRRAALKGWRKRKRGGGRKPTRRRKRNPAGMFKSRGRYTHGKRKRMGLTKSGRYSKRAKRRVTRYTRPKASTARRRARRRNPSGFIGQLLQTGTWATAGQIAIGAVGSSMAAGWVYNRYAPPTFQSGTARMVGRPVSIALAGALVGWGLHTAGMKKFGKQFAWGGIVGAAIDIATQLSGQLAFGTGDYIQLQGLGTQAQVEAGVFGVGTQAQVEAGNFGAGDYVQLDGLGHSEDAIAATNTFGQTF